MVDGKILAYEDLKYIRLTILDRSSLQYDKNKAHLSLSIDDVWRTLSFFLDPHLLKNIAQRTEKNISLLFTLIC